MSLPDDWSGFCGPVPDIKLFGTPLHGKVTVPYVPITGFPRYELHLPNGEVISKQTWAWPNVGQGVVFGIDDGRTWDFGQYGNGGTCYYWRRSDIGPPPDRTAAQQAYDAARGHQWRNDRINARWVWCDAAGDRWTVSINPSVGGSGLSKNFNISLRLTGALNEPAITRSAIISIADPADVGLPADFHGSSDAAWELVLQDVHPIDGKKALLGIARQPVNWSDPVEAETYGWFTLFTLTTDQRDNVLQLPSGTSSSYREQEFPRKVFTAHIELELFGAARDGSWTATPTTVLTRSQTAGTWTASGPLPEPDRFVDHRTFWVLTTTPAPPIDGDPSPTYSTRSAGGEIAWGDPKPAYVSDTDWANRSSFYRGSGSCSVSGTGMVVGVFYDSEGAISVVSTALEHNYSYSLTADISQTGTRYAYNANGGRSELISETRVVTSDFDQQIIESTVYTIRINGTAVHTTTLGATIGYKAVATRTYNGDYFNPQLYSVTGTTTRPVTATTDEITHTGSYTDNTWLATSLGSNLYSASPRESWRLRYGPKGAQGANPAAINLVDERLRDVDGPLAWWRYSLVRASNNCMQLRGGAYGPPLYGWPLKRVRVGPVICPTGAQGGVLTIPDTALQLPPLCCSYNPFEEVVVQDTVPTTFI